MIPVKVIESVHLHHPPFLEAVALGQVPGYSIVNKFGETPDIDAADGFETIWDGTAVWAAPANAETHTFTTNAADILGGAGAEIMEIQGLGPGFNLQSESVILNGAGGVTTSGRYRIIFRMKVIQSNNGANDTMNVGAINAVADVSGTTTATIQVGNNQTLMAIYQVPAGCEALLLDFYMHEGGAKKAASLEGRLWVQPDGQAPQLKEKFSTHEDGDSSLVRVHRAPPHYGEKSLIYMDVDTDTDNSVVQGGFDLLLRNDDLAEDH